MATATVGQTGPEMRNTDPQRYRRLLEEYVHPDRPELEEALGERSLEEVQVRLATETGEQEILERMDPKLNGNAKALGGILRDNIRGVQEKERFLEQAVEQQQTMWQKVKSWAGRHKLLVGTLVAAAAVGGAAYYAGGWAALAKWLGLDALYDWAAETLAGAKETVTNAVERGKEIIGGMGGGEGAKEVVEPRTKEALKKAIEKLGS